MSGTWFRGLAPLLPCFALSLPLSRLQFDLLGNGSCSRPYLHQMMVVKARTLWGRRGKQAELLPFFYPSLVGTKRPAEEKGVTPDSVPTKAVCGRRLRRSWFTHLAGLSPDLSQATSGKGAPGALRRRGPGYLPQLCHLPWPSHFPSSAPVLDKGLGLES